jgi:hypothetical protein
MLTSYHGVVEKGKVRLREPADLAEGTEVLVIAVEPESVEAQKRHLAALSTEEWRKPFDAVRAAWETSEAASKEADLPDDEELSTLVDNARAELTAKRSREKR